MRAFRSVHGVPADHRWRMKRLPQSDSHPTYRGQKENLASGPLAMLVRSSLQTATTAGLRRVIGRTAAVLMLGLWLGLLGLASSERLHHLLHSDSHQANHECLITLISKGHLLGTFIPIAALWAIFVCFGFRHSGEEVLLSIADIRLAPSRAPPVGSPL